MSQGKHCGDRTPKKKGRTALLVICIILAVAAVGTVVYALWERPPMITPGPTPSTNPTETAQPDARPDDSTGEPLDKPDDTAEEIPAAPLMTDRSSGAYTFLLVGRDFASNSTDTIIVGRMDTKAHTVHCVNIPRDTLINISWANTPKKINAVYPGFVNSGKNGIDGLKEQIRNLLGFDVDCYAVVSIKAVEEAVDCIGGVWFDVPVDMFYWDPTQDLSIEISKGYQLLNGENAVKVCRFRDTYAGGDIERIGVQQSFLKATASQILSLGNVPNLGNLVEILMKNTDTDLSAANIAWFARQFLLCGMDDVSFETMPFSTGCYINGVSYVSVDTAAWLSLVNEKLNPYTEQVTTANVSILTSNYSGTVMQSTTGSINGGPDSFYCLSCTVKNGGKAVHHLPGCCPKDEPEPTAEPVEETPTEETPAVTEPETPTEPEMGTEPAE